MKKIGSWIILAILLGGIAFLSFYLFNGEEGSSNQSPTEISPGNSKEHLEKYKEVQIEGYLTKEGDNFVMMGWELKGDKKELEAAVNHHVKANGQGEDFVLKVSSLEVSEDLIQTSEEVVTYDGTIAKEEEGLFIGDIKLTGDINLTSYIGKDVIVFGRKTDEDKLIEVFEVNETSIISGTLEYVAGEPPDIHYKLAGTDFDIHHNIEIYSEEGKHLDLLVYAKSHGVHIDDKHVTLIRILN